MDALDIISSRLEADWPAVHACLDLLFTWVVVRICEANTACLLKALAFLQAVFAYLREQVCRLTLPLCWGAGLLAMEQFCVICSAAVPMKAR